jgi:KaiC/GvpD/RAD55 family RecA-like ATPase
MGARRIVFDAMDVLLALLPGEAARRREMHRLHQWLLDHGLTALITAKAGGEEAGVPCEQPFGFMQFMVDCSVILNHRVDMGVSQRNLRVQKYRGCSFDEDESPFVISKDGFDVAMAYSLARGEPEVSFERVSSGVKRLDTMLGGGYYRGACVLITGFPGTAKTTLSGAFAEAACKRGERTMFFSFDSDGSEMARNLGSVGIQLARYVKSGHLRMISARTISGSAETILVRIKSLVKEQKARCLVIDPVSALSKSGNELTAHAVAERLIDWAKSSGITLVCTSLLDAAWTPDQVEIECLRANRTGHGLSPRGACWRVDSSRSQRVRRHASMARTFSSGVHAGSAHPLLRINRGVSAKIFRSSSVLRFTISVVPSARTAVGSMLPTNVSRSLNASWASWALVLKSISSPSAPLFSIGSRIRSVLPQMCRR